MAINWEKTNLFSHTVKYLGHTLSEEKIFPDIQKAIEYNFTTPPKTKKQLQKVLGFINWFRPFLPQLSGKISVLNDKLKTAKRNIEWCEQDTQIIQGLLDEVKNHKGLHYPDLRKEFYLECDASENGIGAVLYQEQGLIGIFSAKFTPPEKNYTTTEKEFMAVIKALKHFRKIIYGGR